MPAARSGGGTEVDCRLLGVDGQGFGGRRGGGRFGRGVPSHQTRAAARFAFGRFFFRNDYRYYYIY